jgi:transcriptional regulator with XRE-family HTH domain
MLVKVKEASGVLKLEVDGAEVKRLRASRERSATQKEFAHEVGISERRLREIENAKSLIAVDVVDRLARALSVPRTQLCASAPPDSAMLSKPPEKDRFFPRFDTGIAEMVEDEAALMDAASRTQVVLLQIKVRLNEETQSYITELYELASSLSWKGSNRAVLQTDGELPIRRRLRELLVLLKGNDVWVYKTDNIKMLPERHEIPAEPDPFNGEIQLILAAGPPGEYGETSIHVDIDAGQPRMIRY